MGLGVKSLNAAVWSHLEDGRLTEPCFKAALITSMTGIISRTRSLNWWAVVRLQSFARCNQDSSGPRISTSFSHGRRPSREPSLFSSKPPPPLEGRSECSSAQKGVSIPVYYMHISGISISIVTFIAKRYIPQLYTQRRSLHTRVLHNIRLFLPIYLLRTLGSGLVRPG